MSGSRIAAKVHAGLSKAATKLGEPHEHYRPTDPLRPLRLLDLVGEMPAAFDSSPNYKFTTPAKADNALRYALLDGAQVSPGDYLIGPAGTLFVAALPALQPIVCVLCNARLSMKRRAPTADFGVVDAPSGEVAVFTDWPASVLQAGRGGSDDAQLPGDANPASYRALLPVIPEVSPPPRAGDTLTDDMGRRFAVDAFDNTALAWRLSVRLLAVE